MQRSYQDCLKDAAELARRTNLQIILIGAALLVSWLNGIEKQNGELASRTAQFASVTAGSNRVRDEIARQGERGARLGDQLNRERVSYGDRCRPPFDDPSCGVQLHRITSYRQDLDAIANTQQRLTRILDTQKNRRNDVEANLAQQVNFDLGFGLKFPLPFAYAPLIWLLILAFLVVRTFVQRARFWSAVSRGLAQLPSADRSGGRQLIDMPLWLRPVPSGARYRIRGRDFGMVVGWNGRSGSFLSTAILAVLALIAARVTWIGVVASEMVGEVPSAATIPAPIVAALLFSMTLVTGVCVVLGLIWLALPWWTSGSRKLPAYAQRERRLLLIAGMGAIVAVAAPTAIAARSGIRLKGLVKEASLARRFRRRRRWFVVEGRPLKPGWYRSQNSSAIHFIWQGNRVRFTRGLRAKNLQRIAVQVDTGADGPLAWVGSQDFFFVIDSFAERLKRLNRPDEALDVMLKWLAQRSQISGWRTVLPMLDKAGKLVRETGLTRPEPNLARVLQELRELHRNDSEALAALDFRGTKWRNSGLISRAALT